MIAYLILLLAIFSRLMPFLLHIPAMNFSAVGGTLLFFGAKRPRWQSAIAVAALMVTDYMLTTLHYHYPFHVSSYLATWAWYAGVCLFGHRILQRVTAARVVAGVAGSATSFFLVSNFVVWLGIHFQMYPRTLAGLGACYVAGLPFYRNDLIATGVVAGVLFGLPVLATRLAEGFQGRERAA